MERTEMERMIAQHVHPAPPAEELDDLHRRLRDQEAQSALLRALPVEDEEAATPPLPEVRP
jgi:hypothetical protein